MRISISVIQKPTEWTQKDNLQKTISMKGYRFAKDLDYIFVAQYIVETKQVLDDGINFAWRQEPIKGSEGYKKFCFILLITIDCSYTPE